MKRLASLSTSLVASLLVLLVACEQHRDPAWSGYVEAEYTRVAAPISGRLVALPVARGASVVPGQALFVLDRENEQAGVDQAAAKLKHSEAQARDLDKGKRADEIAVTQAQLEAARASLRQSEDELKRQRALAQSGFTSGANLEALESQVRRDKARVAELDAQLRVARLAAREDTRVAAQADIAAGHAELDQAKWKLDQKTIAATAAARVEDTLYRPGEWIPAGSPVVSLLAPDAIKIRFFVPQTALAAISVGSEVRVSCDGCGQPIAATVGFVSATAEFTPPVLYSRDQRAKLVFLVEARARPADAPRLHPGQPVDVEPAANAKAGGPAK